MDPSDLLDDPRITLMGLFVEAYGEVMREVAAQERDHGLAVAEFDVLLRLSRSPGRRLRISDLCLQTGLTSGGMTRLVDRLAAREFVERGVDPADRRVVLARLTEAGTTKVAEVLPGHLDILERTLTRPLPDADRDALAAALRKIRDNAVRTRSATA
ncbi:MULTISPECIES: MarR family transcriptional regulator [unclassified Nocardia]|uniref:MarR family winged helix-turn-helix transcriptional regulator n=1 Tax=unclassified Nocardia TaxID=2637762 RepID=UPI0024A84969|nr:MULTISPECIES: MarR family transcriptional regulator [unclassified Nocardia]